MLKLAGEVADGALLTSPIQLLPDHVKIIKESAERAGRDASKIDIANTARFSISTDEEKAREVTKPNIAFMITNLPTTWLDALGVTKAEQEEMKKTLFRGGLAEARKKVTQSMIDSMAITGTPAACTRRIRGMMKMGISQLIMSSPFGPDLEEAVRLISNEVIPKLG